MQANSKAFDQIGLQAVREIATRKLQQLSRSDESVRDSYLIKKEFFVGVRYEIRPFQFIWKLDESHASIERNGLVIESVTLYSDGTEQRRAA